jgi:hypothetical protein
VINIKTDLRKAGFQDQGCTELVVRIRGEQNWLRTVANDGDEPSGCAATMLDVY